MAPPAHRQRRPQRHGNPSEDTPSFGAWLRQQRRALDWTQAELAQRVGCARITVRRIEANELKPSQQLAELFAEHLGVPPTERKRWLQFARGLAPMPQSQVTDLPAPTPAMPPGPPTNLPAPLTTFLGRDHEIIDGCRLVTTSRLLTLTGVGGAGKTRLALEIARSILNTSETDNPNSKIQSLSWKDLKFPDGVWWVELAPLTDAALIPETVAKALGLREQPGQSLEQLLTETLKTRQMLLLLDNCEHLVAGCAAWVHQWLRHCPHLHILATSREPLQLLGEQRFPVAPLAAAAASELFVQRARLVDPAFTRTVADGAAIDQLCQQVDYLPLAIELLAARSDLFTPQVMLERLQARSLDLLSTELRNLPARQRTLRHTIQHSYDLLNEREQALFRTLGVFVGGFDLAAVLHLGFDEVTLQALINKSLVQVAVRHLSENGERRFILLETLQAYASEMMQANGESQAAHERHAHYFLALAENAHQQIGCDQENTYHECLEQELDNIRAGLRFYFATDTESALLLAGALREFWCKRGYLNEGRHWLTQALAKSQSVLSCTRGRALRGVGKLALTQGDYDLATALFEQSLHLYQQLGDQLGIASSLNFLGAVALYQHDLSKAEPLFRQSLALRQAINDSGGVAGTLGNLGLVAMYQGDYIQARVWLEQDLAISCAISDHSNTEIALVNLGYNELHCGAYREATNYFIQGIHMALYSGDRETIVYCLEGLAEIDALYGTNRKDKGRATRLLGAAEALRNTLGTPLPPMDRIFYERSLSAIRTEITDTTFTMMIAEGKAMAMDEAITYALSVRYDNSIADHISDAALRASFLGLPAVKAIG